MRVLVVGGATIDVIATIDTADIECLTMRNATNSYLMMEQGKKADALKIDSQIGGGACNASVAIARLGADVSSVLRLGNDAEAERILERLREENIDTGFVSKNKDEMTGKAIVISSHDRNSGIFVHRGANTTMRAKDICEQMFENVDLVYVSTLSSQSAKIFPKVVELAKKAGAYVVCNPGIRQIRRRREQVLEALRWVDVLAINKEEAIALAEGQLPVYESCEIENSNDPQLIREGFGDQKARMEIGDFAKKITEIGCEYLIVTNGAEGAYLASKNAVFFRPSVPCEVESTIGAGDAFNATFATAITQKKTIWTALSMAAVNAASVASSSDTQSGLMSADELNKRVLSMDSSRIRSFPIEED